MFNIRGSVFHGVRNLAQFVRRSPEIGSAGRARARGAAAGPQPPRRAERAVSLLGVACRLFARFRSVLGRAARAQPMNISGRPPPLYLHLHFRTPYLDDDELLNITTPRPRRERAHTPCTQPLALRVVSPLARHLQVLTRHLVLRVEPHGVPKVAQRLIVPA